MVCNIPLHFRILKLIEDLLRCVSLIFILKRFERCHLRRIDMPLQYLQCIYR